MGGQREILAALTDLKGSLKWVVHEHAEMRESLERRSMHRDDKEMMSQQSSASRHARHRAGDIGGTHREYDGRGSRRDEVRPREGRRSGARVGDRGAAVKWWLEVYGLLWSFLSEERAGQGLPQQGQCCRWW